MTAPVPAQPPRWLAVALALAVVVAAGLGVWALRSPAVPEPPPPPAPAPTPTPTLTPTPTPTPTPTMTVILGEVVVEPTDNAALVGGAPAPPDPVAVDAAVNASVARLTRYLNAVYAAPESRFTRGPLGDLLTDAAAAALTPPGEEALGALGIEAERVAVDPVTVDATVLADASGAGAVVLSFDATVDVDLEDGTGGALRQRAEVVFVPVDGGWKASAADAELTVPRSVEAARGAAPEATR